MARNELILLAVKEKIGSCGLSDEAFMAAFDPWEVMPYYFAGDLTAVAFSQGSEFHLARIVNTVPNLRKIFHDFAKSTLDKYGHATTTVEFLDRESAMFIERIGFRRTGKNDIGYTYRLDRADWRF